jgi:hypothetical protein
MENSGTKEMVRMAEWEGQCNGEAILPRRNGRGGAEVKISGKREA